MIIRDYTPDDEMAVVQLWESCGLTRPWNDPQKDIQRRLTAPLGAFWVGQVGDRIIASIMVGYDGHRGSVNYLAIDPEFSGQGLGRLLMEQAEALLVQLGCPKINLCVRHDNEAVLEFYQQLGYAPDHAVLLGKRLIPDE